MSNKISGQGKISFDWCRAEIRKPEMCKFIDDSQEVLMIDIFLSPNINTLLDRTGTLENGNSSMKTNKLNIRI